MKPKLRHSPFKTAALGAAALALVSGCRPRGDSAIIYQTAAVSSGDIAEHVTATGSLSALVSVDVGSQVSGKIAALAVDFNSPVKKGALVAEIDPTVYAAQLRQAKGDLASAQADVTLKRQNLERKKVLAPQRAASQLDLDQAVAELAQAQANVEIKEAAVESAAANLGYCKITAPVDGIVISRKVDVGQTVIAAMSTPVLFTIAQDLTKMNISADVAEADIGQIRPKERVDFTVDAFPDQVFHGEVVQVRKAPITTQNVVTYETIIAVENPEQKLFPGMTADVSILVAERTGVLKIPETALRYTPPDSVALEKAPPSRIESNQRLVYTLGDGPGQIRPTVIRTGISDGLFTEVANGLAAGERVIVSNLSSGAGRGGFFGAPPPPTP
jgi:HlyD family secretion protein